MDEYPYPLIVKGDLRPEDPESVKDRHQIYFQSKKKVLGGDCVCGTNVCKLIIRESFIQVAAVIIVTTLRLCFKVL